MIAPGTRVLVTGGSSGIGAATAATFASRGCAVVVVGRDSGALTEVARRTGARPCRADLTEPDAVDAVLAEAGEVDVVVAAAGVGWAGRLADMPDRDIETLLRTNVLAPARLARAVLPDMARRGRGHLVFVSSIAGHLAVADEAVYSATKAAVNTLAGSLRHEARRHGVGVSIVVPGVVDTAFFTRRGTPYHRRTPRPVAAEVVAAAVVRAVEHRRAEVFVPRWLRLPARLRGLAPGLTDAAQRRFG
ncbi:short-chain dehydrogenase [Saccharomonospora piscinae]|uniref:Short-chain dehydrogenase n=1 Tax=Saccharomonospora piscinae TaxID=687388 RepID=A0A1V9AA04_SACPI|nr:SDR family NAD(P)-dependent oxidoreductase [Saccharomonospora piscinae]OQO93900.1 short-chain dehydrogenase [Saccharomonospora piscinae]